MELSAYEKNKLKTDLVLLSSTSIHCMSHLVEDNWMMIYSEFERVQQVAQRIRVNLEKVDVGQKAW